MRERTDRRNVEDGRDAKVSLQHSVAAAFLFGTAGLAQFENDCIADPAVRALRARVVFEEDPAAPIESATVTVQLADGAPTGAHWRVAHGFVGVTDRCDDHATEKRSALAAVGAQLMQISGGPTAHPASKVSK
jgi:2-methylcitrate dehydratase PrpD